jgi:hypothetical protein
MTSSFGDLPAVQQVWWLVYAKNKKIGEILWAHSTPPQVGDELQKPGFIKGHTNHTITDVDADRKIITVESTKNPTGMSKGTITPNPLF